MVLCYSRMMYLEFTVSQSAEHFLACHQNAFDFFGGVPQRIMIDNLRAGVLKHLVGEPAVLNPRYLDFANHYGFTITACNVRKANEKGRVENGVGYVKKNLLNGLASPQFTEIRTMATDWLETVANVRIHGATKKTPMSMFPEDKAALSPIPLAPYDVSLLHNMRASSQFRITLDTNHYSVPAEYASKRVNVRSFPDKICIYYEGNLIARHCRVYDRHQDIENPDHPKALLAERKGAKEQKLLAQFLGISSRSDEFYQKLVEKRLNPRIHIRKIIALYEIYGKEAVASAIEDSFRFEAFSSDCITNILESRKKILPDSGPLHVPRNEDLLEIDLDTPDLTIYDIPEPKYS